MIEFLLAASMMLNEEIGSVKTSGLFLKDSIQLNYFVDLNYESISCYVTQPKKNHSLLLIRVILQLTVSSMESFQKIQKKI